MRNMRVTSSGCWEWTKYTDRYGIIRINKRSYKVHRVAWEEFCGPIPDELKVLHHCDNPPCFRPAHLFTGTQEDNVRDCAAKGRLVPPPPCPPEKRARDDRNGMRTHPESLRGEKNGRSKVSDSERRMIATMSADGRSGESLSVLFGLSVSQIMRTCREYKDRLRAGEL